MQLLPVRAKHASPLKGIIEKTGRHASSNLKPTFASADSVCFGAQKRLIQLENQVFKLIEPCLPVAVGHEELESLSPDEIRRRKKARFETWLNQFQPGDRRMALTFLQKLRYIDHPRLLGHLQNSHQKLMKALAEDGFITPGAGNPYARVDFTNLYQASSGELIGYHYRKTNRIPKVNFHDQAALATNGQDKSDRALVIVDDYLATGAQFFCEALGHGDSLHHDQNRHLADLFMQYQKVYFVVAGVHEKALERFRMIEQGRIPEAVAHILEGYQDLGNPQYEKPVREKLAATLHGNKLRLISSFVETPLLSGRNERVSPAESDALRRFLTAYNVYKYPFGVGNLQGNTVFYYSAPNNLPDMLWNSKSSRLNPDGSQDKSRRWTPLFHRLEDVSAYWFVREKQVPLEHQLW